MPLCLLFLDRLYYVRCGKNTSLHAQLVETELLPFAQNIWRESLCTTFVHHLVVQSSHRETGRDPF